MREEIINGNKLIWKKFDLISKKLKNLSDYLDTAEEYNDVNTVISLCSSVSQDLDKLACDIDNGVI